MLLGRASECTRIQAALDAALAGESAVVVVSGEPGIGKSALLEYAVAAGGGMTVLATRGFESESELAFASLTELLRPLEQDLGALRDVQREALAAALAIGPPVDAEPLTVCVAALDLVAVAAERDPLLIVIDDAHWLDRPTAEVVSFLTRRLHAERVAVLVATRPAAGAFDSGGLAVIELDGLEPDAAAELAGAAAPVNAAVAAQLAALTGGNPLALVELTGSLTDAQRAGAEPLVEPVPASGWAQHVFGQRLEQLPGPARRALLIAAAAGSDEMVPVARALAVEHLEVSALEPAELAGLIVLSPDRVVFRHPLVASAVYHLAAAPDVRSAHAALAAALVEEGREDERAWHMALAAVEPDATVAAAMGEVGRSAQRRGGFAAAARAYLRAATLEPDREARARLILAAADCSQRMGAIAAARHCLDQVEQLHVTGVEAARADLLRGRIEARTGSTLRAFDLMRSSANLLEPVDPAAAALALVESVDPCIRSGQPALALETAERASRLAAGTSGPAALYAQVATAAAKVFLGDAGEASRLALAAADEALGELAHDLQLRSYLGMTLAFAAEWDRARSVLADTVAACERVAPAMLPYPLTAQGWLERGTGQWTAAVGDLELAIERSRETGRANDETWAHSILAWICAARGQAGQVEVHVARQLELAERLGLPYQALTTDAARGLLALGAGEAADAIPPLQRALDRKRALGFCDATTHPSLTPDLVEALVRCDRRDEAAELTARFEQEASRPGGRALALRCRGLLAPDDDASELFDQAAELHRLADDPFGLARTQLAHGERLRRAGQRKRSRELLDAAREGFTALDAVPWLARTDEEDGRSARVLRSDPADRDELTPSEHQVASLAVRGLQNREIAQRLFMSSKTVEAHLTRIYRKVGVRTRVELVHSYRPRPVAAE